MLKYLSKVRIEFHALDPRAPACLEFLAHCYAPKAKKSNPACVVDVKRRTDDGPAEIGVTYIDGAEEVFDVASTSVKAIRNTLLDKGVYLDTEKKFREASYPWPVVIPPEELQMPVPKTKLPVPETKPMETKVKKKVCPVLLRLMRERSR